MWSLVGRRAATFGIDLYVPLMSPCFPFRLKREAANETEFRSRIDGGANQRCRLL